LQPQKDLLFSAITFCKFIENIENDSAYQLRYKLANQTF